MAEQQNFDPYGIPQSPEVRGAEEDELGRRVRALFAAAEFQSREWALELREQYEKNPRDVEELAMALDLDQLAGLSTQNKIA